MRIGKAHRTVGALLRFELHEIEMYYRGDKVGRETEIVREMRGDGDIEVKNG